MGLRMTPMIDVIFLLLTFFVLTARFEKPEQSLPLAFGDAVPAASQSPPPLELAIVPVEGGCAVTVGGTERILITPQTPAEGLAGITKRVQAMLTAGGKKTLRLRCDDAASWDIVSKVYDVLYGMGARQITFVMDE